MIKISLVTHVLRELIQEFVSYIEAKGFSPNTLRAYSKDLEDFLDFVSKSGVRTPDEMDHHVIERYVMDILKRGKKDATVERRLSSIKSFFRFLEQRGIIRHNRAELVPFRKRRERMPQYLDEEDAISLIQTEKERDRLIFLILYGCGLRVSELENLRVCDISGGFLKVLGKGGKYRTVPLPDVVKDEIDFYIANVRPRYLKGKEDSGYLLLNRYGERLSSRYIRSIVKRHGFVKTGKNIWPHLLRHSYATHLVGNNADIRAVQELLGHSSINTTQRYIHTSFSEILELYRRTHPREKPDSTEREFRK